MITTERIRAERIPGPGIPGVVRPHALALHGHTFPLGGGKPARSEKTASRLI
jgi:hypothetical protein